MEMGMMMEVEVAWNHRMASRFHVLACIATNSNPIKVAGRRSCAAGSGGGELRTQKRSVSEV